MNIPILKAIEIVDDLLYGYVLLPGLRDDEGRNLMIFPLPDKDSIATYDKLQTVASYLISIPKKSVINKGFVALVDASDNDWLRISEVLFLIQHLQAKNAGCVVLIHVIAKPKYKTKTMAKIKENIRNMGIEVKVHTSEELSKVLPASSLLARYGGKIQYDNNIWVKFRLNVEPFLSDCQSMARRLDDIVEPLADVDGVILACNYDVNMVGNKYRQLAQDTMKNLHMEQLLHEGAILIERYVETARSYPDMQDTLAQMSSALSHLKELQGKVQSLAVKGQTMVESRAVYQNFKKHCDEILAEIRSQYTQVSDVSEDGMYDVSSVEIKQQQLSQLWISSENIHKSVQKFVNNGMTSNDATTLKSAQKYVRELQTSWERLATLQKKKKDKFAEVLAFHQLVEECIAWFFGGIQRFTSQPVEGCNTLEGICALELELDRHLSRCPIQGYTSLESRAADIGTLAVRSRVNMIRSKFALFQTIVKQRQDYLRTLKGGILQKHRNTAHSNKTTMTGLRPKNDRYKDIKQTQSTQFDKKDVYGWAHNANIQTDLVCVCIQDRVNHLSDRTSTVETKLNIADRAVSLNIKTSIKEQLTLILRRINIIENYLKRLRFSTVYGSFSNHTRHSCKSSPELLSDLNSSSFNDSGFNSHHVTGIEDLSVFTPSTTVSSSPTVRLSPRPGNDPLDISYPYLNISDAIFGGEVSPVSIRKYSDSKKKQNSVSDKPSIRVADSLGEKLAEIEKLLNDIEYDVKHNLKVDSETQTIWSCERSHSSELTDSETQTESDSDDSESIGIQFSAATVTSSTQHDIETSSQRIQCSPRTNSASTGARIPQTTASSQSDVVLRRVSGSQTSTTPLKHTSSQHAVSNASKSVQFNHVGRDAGTQNCPVHSERAVQHSPDSIQSSSQTDSQDFTSSESQYESDEVDGFTQTDMIGLFPASVQTDVQHFAAKYCQTVYQTSDAGVTAAASVADKTQSADIKPANHKDSSADIKPSNHKETTADIKSGNHKESTADIKPNNHVVINAVIETTTRGTAARFIKMFTKKIETVPKRIRMSEVQATVEQADTAQDTSDICTTDDQKTDTDNLLFYDTESTQTLLFDPVLVTRPSQTEFHQTLLQCDIPTPKCSAATQTSEDHLTETDGGDKASTDRGKSRKGKSYQYSLQSRSEPFMSFKDVSYNKNRTHELRIAKFKKSGEGKEEEESKIKRKHIPKKRVSKKKLLVEEEKCTCEETSPPPPNDVITVAASGEVPRDVPKILILDEHSSEEERSSDEDDSSVSYIFPIEELPSPIKARVQSNYDMSNTQLPKKLQYVLQEMLVTESSYVLDLRHVVEGYLEPMERHPDSAINSLAENIFLNFRPICSFHGDTFKTSLVTAALSQQPLKDVANTFTRHEQELSIYLDFMVQERRAHAIVQQNHDGYIRELEQTLDDKLGLTAYLLKPTQRMVKYKQFLDIMLAGSEEFEVIEEVSEAQSMITNILQRSNNMCHREALQLPPEISQDSTGELLKQGEFSVSVNGRQKRKRRVFLFEDMIVFSKEDLGMSTKGTHSNSTLYRTKYTVGMQEICVIPYMSDEPFKCHVYTNESTFSMFAETPTVAETWSKAISNILWGQLKQIKKDRDMSRMRKTRGRGTSRGGRAILRVRNT